MTNQWSRRCVVVMACWLLPAVAWADRLHLTNGRVLEGVVVRETPSQVVVQVAWEGYVFLDREAIATIEAADEPARQHLLAQWQQEFRQAQEREQQRQEFEAAQRAKGLVEYQGRWVTPQEVAAIKEEQVEAQRRRKEEQERQRAEAEAQARQAEIQELIEQLHTLQVEQARLQEELAHQRLWLRHVPVLINQCDPNLVRDAQGNLMRLQAHEGHRFLVTPDGRHVDVQAHADHLSFLDDRGRHQDLR